MKRGLMVQCGQPRFKHQLCHLVLNSLGRVTWLFACFSICKMVMILMPPPGVVVRNKWVNMLKALSTVCFLLVHSYPLLLWAFLVGSAPEVDVHHLGDLPGVTYSTFVPPLPHILFFPVLAGLWEEDTHLDVTTKMSSNIAKGLLVDKITPGWKIIALMVNGIGSGATRTWDQVSGLSLMVLECRVCVIGITNPLHLEQLLNFSIPQCPHP